MIDEDNSVNMENVDAVATPRGKGYHHGDLRAAVIAAGMKRLTEGPASFYSGFFDLAAKQLRVQADFIQDLGNCSNALDLFKHQGKFIQSYWSSFAEEAWKTYGRGAKPGSSTDK